MIKYSSVSKAYTKEIGAARTFALKDLSFELGKGQTLGLIGANGAGKSTCIRLLMDFIRPDSGSIFLNGESPQNNLLRCDIGYLPEVASLPSNLTILDMVRFSGATHGMTRKELATQAEFWLKKLGLWDVRKKAISTFSKGMQQRAGFVLALVHDPSLLILDEPMSGLDPVGRSEIISLIRDLKAKGKTILFCSHVLEDVDKLADELLILHKGRKKFAGTVVDLHSTYQCSSIVDGFMSVISGGDENA